MFKNFSRSVECMPLWNFDFYDKSLTLNEQNKAFLQNQKIFRKKPHISHLRL